jgi:drug/metabolite transporter (DMT)-like permease
VKSLPKKQFSAPIGASLIILSSFFYASYGIWTKLMGDFFDGYMASALRSILVVCLLFPIAFYYKRFEPLNLRKNWPYIAGMLISSLFTWGPLYFAILQAGVGISLAVTYAAIVIGMFFFGWLFAAEKFTKDKAISAALGFVGLALIFSPAISNLAWIALGAAVVSGLSSAANSVFAKKIEYNSTQSTIVLWVVSIVANMFMVFVSHKAYPAFGLQIEWFYLILFAIASVIASWSFVRGVKLIDAGVAGILGLLEIVFGVVFGTVLFQERPTVIALMGMAVIMIAAAIPYFREFSTRNK